MHRKYFVQATTNINELQPIKEKEDILHTMVEKFPQIFAGRQLLLLGSKVRLGIDDPLKPNAYREPDLVFIAEDGMVIIVEIKAQTLKHEAISQVWEYYNLIKSKSFDWFEQTYLVNHGKPFKEGVRELYFDEGGDSEDLIDQWINQINLSFNLVLIAPEIDQSAIRVINAQYQERIPITGIEIKSYAIPGRNKDEDRMVDARIVAGNPDILSAITDKPITSPSEQDLSRKVAAKIEEYLHRDLSRLSDTNPNFAKLYIKPGSGRYRLILDRILEIYYVWYSITVYNDGRNVEFFIETYMGGDGWNNCRGIVHELFEGKLGSDIIQGRSKGKKQWSKKFEISPESNFQNEVKNIVLEFVSFISMTYPKLVERLQLI